jgi:predicted dehydrogenase
MKEVSNAVIIGAGSIAKRHSANLNSLGVSTRLIDIDEIAHIDTILQSGFDVGLVCSPNCYHIEHCAALAKFNIPIFCEKPFYSSRQGLQALLGLVRSTNLPTMVACNLRFTQEVKSINPSTPYINVYFGFNLKKWRPHTNHRDSYSSHKKYGGGILLDAIHELDYLSYKFGAIKNLFYSKNKFSNITHDTEDNVVGRIEFAKGTIADFTLNYLSDTYLRYFDILHKNTLKRIHFDTNNSYMYRDQIDYFIKQIQRGKEAMNNFDEAHSLLSALNNPTVPPPPQ